MFKQQFHDIFLVLIGLFLIIGMMSWLAFKSEGRCIYYFFIIITLTSTYFSWIKLSIGAYTNKEFRPLVTKYGPSIVILPIFIMNIFILWISGFIAFEINMKFEDIFRYSILFLVISYLLWNYGYSLTMRAFKRKNDLVLDYLFMVLTFGTILFTSIAELLSNGPIVTGIASALMIIISTFLVMRILSSGGFELLWGPLFLGALLTFEIAQIDIGRGFYFLEVILFGKGGTTGAIIAESIVTGSILAMSSGKI